MQVTVLLFAAAKQAAGQTDITVEVQDDATANELLGELARKLPSIEALLPSCRIAVDCTYVTGDTRIGSGSEIALIPPVSGG